MESGPTVYGTTSCPGQDTPQEGLTPNGSRVENLKGLKDFNPYLDGGSFQSHQKVFKIFGVVPQVGGRLGKKLPWLAPTPSYLKNKSSSFHVPELRSGQDAKS